VVRYQRNLLDRGFEKSLRQRMIPLKVFIPWAADGELIDVDPGIILPPLPKEFMTDPDVADLDDASAMIRELKMPHKLAAMLMMDLGLRNAEVRKIRWRDFDAETKALFVHGKGGKNRRLPYDASDELRRVVEMCRGDDDHYAVSKNGLSFMSASTLGKAFGRACEDAGVKHITPHSVRHAFSRRHAIGGTSAAVLSSALGHSSLDTTDRYLKSLENDVEAIRIGLRN